MVKILTFWLGLGRGREKKWLGLVAQYRKTVMWLKCLAKQSGNL